MPINKQSIRRVRVALGHAIDDASGRKTSAAVYAILLSGIEAAKTMTPMDTANLVNSAYAPVVGNDGRGYVGFTAEYAKWVHDAPGTLRGKERPDNRGRYWAPTGEPKFLDKGFKEIKPSIPAILRQIYAPKK